MKQTEVVSIKKWKLLEGKENIKNIKKHENDRVEGYKIYFWVFSILYLVVFTTIFIICLSIKADEHVIQTMIEIYQIFFMLMGIVYLFIRFIIKNVKSDSIANKKIYYQLIRILEKKRVSISGISNLTFEIQLDTGGTKKVTVDSHTFDIIHTVGAYAVTANPNSEVIHSILPLHSFNFERLEENEISLIDKKEE